MNHRGTPRSFVDQADQRVQDGPRARCEDDRAERISIAPASRPRCRQRTTYRDRPRRRWLRSNVSRSLRRCSSPVASSCSRASARRRIAAGRRAGQGRAFTRHLTQGARSGSVEPRLVPGPLEHLATAFLRSTDGQDARTCPPSLSTATMAPAPSPGGETSSTMTTDVPDVKHPSSASPCRASWLVADGECIEGEAAAAGGGGEA